MSPGRHTFHIGKQATHQYKNHYEKESNKHGLLLGFANSGNEQTKPQNTGYIHYGEQIECTQAAYNRDIVHKM